MMDPDKETATVAVASIQNILRSNPPPSTIARQSRDLACNTGFRFLFGAGGKKLTINRGLLACLIAVVLPGCAVFVSMRSSQEMISKGDRSGRYCFDKSLAIVTSRVMTYIDKNDAREASSVEMDMPVYEGKKIVSYEKTTSYVAEVKSHVENLSGSSRVSINNGGRFVMVAVVKENPGDRACGTSVEFYQALMTPWWDAKHKKIERFVNSDKL